MRNAPHSAISQHVLMGSNVELARLTLTSSSGTQNAISQPWCWRVLHLIKLWNRKRGLEPPSSAGEPSTRRWPPCTEAGWPFTQLKLAAEAWGCEVVYLTSGKGPRSHWREAVESYERSGWGGRRGAGGKTADPANNCRGWRRDVATTATFLAIKGAKHLLTVVGDELAADQYAPEEMRQTAKPGRFYTTELYKNCMLDIHSMTILCTDTYYCIMLYCIVSYNVISFWSGQSEPVLVANVSVYFTVI